MDFLFFHRCAVYTVEIKPMSYTAQSKYHLIGQVIGAGIKISTWDTYIHYQSAWD